MNFNSFEQMKGLTWYNNYVNILQWHKRKCELRPPIGVTIDLTTTCNLHCKGCNAMRSWNKGRHLETNEVLAMIDYLYDWKVEKGNLYSICFAGGGEPTLHPGFPKIIKYASEKGFEVGMSTNGTMLNNKKVSKAIVKYADFCGVSVDAGTIETWNDYKQVNKGYLNLMLGIRNTIKLIKSNGPRSNKRHGKLDFVFKFLITPSNQKDILQAAMNAKNIGFSSFFIRPAAMDHIESFGMMDKKLDRDYIFEMIEKAKEVTMMNGDFVVHSSFGRVNPKTLGRIQKFKKCYATPLILQICADGYFYLCIDSRYILSRRLVKWDEVRGFWGGMTHKKIINQIRTRDCPRCAFGLYNEQIEKAVINDDLWRNFP